MDSMSTSNPLGRKIKTPQPGAPKHKAVSF